MQSAETVLGVLRERGGRGLPCEELYRQMFNPQLYLLAYGRIYANQGAMTPGATQETADGMSCGRSTGSSRRCATSGTASARSAGSTSRRRTGRRARWALPSWSDKLVGEVVRLLLEAYYEPTFSDRSHGFRPGRGCHTALREVAADLDRGRTWFIEGDISDCFGSFDHEIMLGILSEKIHDNRFLRLIRNMLKAGYLEDWRYHDTLSGVPQGGVVSPDPLEHLPAQAGQVRRDGTDPAVHPRSTAQTPNPSTDRMDARIRTGTRDAATGHEARDLARQTAHASPPATRTTPATVGCATAGTPMTILLGFTGPKAEAETDQGPGWRRSCATTSHWNSTRTRP